MNPENKLQEDIGLSIKEVKPTESRVKNGEERDVAVLEPPDGGWAWVILLATCTVAAAITMPVSVYAIIYSRILMRSDVTTTTVAWIFNIHQAMWNLFPIFAVPLCVTYGYRKVAFGGTFLCAISIILSAFSTEPYHLFITYSLLFGAGIGSAYPACNFIIPQYFKKYRARAIGAMMASIGVSFFITPMLIIKLQMLYDHRGVIIVLGAIMLNGCVAACLFHPIEWHAKVRKEKEEEANQTDGLLPPQSRAIDSSRQSLELNRDKNLQSNLEPEFKIKRIRQLSECSATSFDSLKTLSRKYSPEIVRLLDQEKDTGSSKEIIKFEDKKHRRVKHEAKEARLRRIRNLSECSVNSFNSINELYTSNKLLENNKLTNNDNCKVFTAENNSLSFKFVKFFKSIFENFLLAKSHRMKIIMLSVPMIIIVDINSLMMVPFLIIESGHSIQDASLVLSLYALGNIISRFGITILVDKLQLSTKYYFMAGTLLTALSVFALTVVSDIRLFSVASFSYGFGYGIPVTLNALVQMEFMGLELLQKSFSLCSFTLAFVLITIGPLIGLIRDVSGSYKFTLRILSIVGFVSFLIFFLMPWAQRSDERRGVAQLNNKGNDVDEAAQK